MRISDWSSDVCSSDLASGSPCSGDTVNRTGARRMIDLHYWPTPNGHKITMFLEETGLDYRILPVNIGAGDQFKPDFLKIAPNNRMPAIVDHDPAEDRKSTRLNSSH